MQRSVSARGILLEGGYAVAKREFGDTWQRVQSGGDQTAASIDGDSAGTDSHTVLDHGANSLPWRATLLC